MKPLNEAQMEAAARNMCELLGVDPDQVVEFNGDSHEHAGRTRWQIQAIELYFQERRELALAHGREQKHLIEIELTPAGIEILEGET